ncbi:MAG: hypothetical protein K6C06_05840 [Lachnospiraceae bacterium]|nr:hypothetical protein [Lachnospiraceae bacterium]
MKTKLLYQNLSLSGERRCFGQTLVPEENGTALLLGEAADRRTEQAAEKLARAGIALAVAKTLGWEEARRLCIQKEGRCSLQDLPFPEQASREKAQAAVWFYLSLREDPGSPEELIALYNGMLSFMSPGEEEKKLEDLLGRPVAADLLRAVRAVQTRQDDPEDSCDVKKLCEAVDLSAVRDVFLKASVNDSFQL